jgi:hypothetical protein
MFERQPLSEVQPQCHLVCEVQPPLGVDIWIITRWGNGYRGLYRADDPSIVAWSPLPKLSPDQKETLKELGLI